MSKIKGHDNRETELALALLMRLNRIRGWRRHSSLIGKPDFVFGKQRLAVFVDGCFWHGCPRHSNMPRNNRDFWRRKLLSNKVRDRFVGKSLRECGWRVLRIWEHELTNSEKVSQRIRNAIKSA